MGHRFVAGDWAMMLRCATEFERLGFIGYGGWGWITKPVSAMNPSMRPGLWVPKTPSMGCDLRVLGCS
jgi:hypothetical protein